MWVKGCVRVKILKSKNKDPCVPSVYIYPKFLTKVSRMIKKLESGLNSA